jgi:hypothetical protein
VVGVEQWAEARRMKRVEGLSAQEISRRTGLARDTVSRLLAAQAPPRYSRALAGSILDPFKEWICEQPRADPKVSRIVGFPQLWSREFPTWLSVQRAGSRGGESVA